MVSIATERAAKAGILITDRRALEAMRTVDAVLFDKTGTLTRGEPAVVAATATTTTVSEDEVVALAAAAEADSEHPLGRAIVTAAADRGLNVPSASDFAARNGIGVTATVGGATVSVGGPGMLTEHDLSGAPEAARWVEQGSTVLHVLRNGQVVGALALADAIRPESAQAIDALHARGRITSQFDGGAYDAALEEITMDVTDFAAAVLRLVIGATMVAHGVNHWVGGSRIAGTARWFAGLGLRNSVLQAWLSVITEISAGVLLILGLLTPFVAAAVISAMLVAWLLAHRKNGFFVFREGYEYVLVLTTVALALGLLGPGWLSLDHALGIEIAGWGGGAIALGLGVLGTAALLSAFYRPASSGHQR